MILIGRGVASQSGFTIPYHIPRIHGAITWCIRLSGDHYQCLPSGRSEFEPAAGDLYQTLPPRRRQLTTDLSVGEVVWVIIAYNDGEPWTPSEVAHTVGQVSKRKSSDRPVGLQKIEHGGKTGRAMIKYPHTKKNAQQENRSAYPGR